MQSKPITIKRVFEPSLPNEEIEAYRVFAGVYLKKALREAIDVLGDLFVDSVAEDKAMIGIIVEMRKIAVLQLEQYDFDPKIYFRESVLRGMIEKCADKDSEEKFEEVYTNILQSIGQIVSHIKFADRMKKDSGGDLDVSVNRFLAECGQPKNFSSSCLKWFFDFLNDYAKQKFFMEKALPVSSRISIFTQTALALEIPMSQMPDKVFFVKEKVAEQIAGNIFAPQEGLQR